MSLPPFPAFNFHAFSSPRFDELCTRGSCILQIASLAFGISYSLYLLISLNYTLYLSPMFLGISPYAPSYGSRLQNAQGKVAELRQELNSGGKKDKNYSAKKIALKKIVANMTMSNNDMIALFPDVIGCMNLPSLEIKKMYARTVPIVYAGMQSSFADRISRCFLFLVNYSRMKPEIALKALPILVDVWYRCTEGSFELI
jgi:hypothetical protein